jgi:uncharacterized membrane protein
MTRSRSSREAARRSVIAGLAAISFVAAACSDRAATEPTTLMRTAVAANADRSAPTFLPLTTVDVAGALGTSVQGINARGDVSGTYVDAAGRSHGFLRIDGVVTTIDYPGADGTEVLGVGPDGDVVGAHWNDDEERVAFHGFRRTAGGAFQPVHYPGHLYEIPQRILPDGTILGCRHDHDLMASMTGMMIARAESSEITPFASMSNGATPDRHQIVGFYTNMNVMPSRSEGFTIENGVFKPFLIPGSNLTTAWDVNPRGDIVGVYRNSAGVHGYVLTDGGYTTLDGPGASATRAFGINARGDVVGAYVAGGVTHGFLATRQ